VVRGSTNKTSAMFGIDLLMFYQTPSYM